jgi:hypothetical protein
VSETLAPEASLLLDLATFHAADVPLANNEPVVEHVFRSFCRIEPNAELAGLHLG